MWPVLLPFCSPSSYWVENRHYSLPSFPVLTNPLPPQSLSVGGVSARDSSSCGVGVSFVSQRGGGALVKCGDYLSHELASTSLAVVFGSSTLFYCSSRWGKCACSKDRGWRHSGARLCRDGDSLAAEMQQSKLYGDIQHSVHRIGFRWKMGKQRLGRGRLKSPQAILQWNRRPVYTGVAPRVVVITSGKGGVGKTTTTANLGMCLARLNFKVVAIDADVGLRNLDLLLGLENRVNYTAMEVLNGECRLDQALIRDKRWTNFELLCINKPRYKMPLGFGGKALTWLVDALKKRPKGSPDFVLIDCPAGIDAGFITAITPANEAVLVTTPDITSLRDADRVTGLLECDGIKDIKMVVNRVRSDMIKGEDMMSVLDVQEMLGLPLLGVIPEDSEVIKSTNRGYPLVLKRPPTLAGLALEQAAWRLVEQDSMKAVLIEEAPAKRNFLPW